MDTKVLALGDSWFHYPRGLDKDGKPIFLFKFRRWLGLIRDRGNGNLIYYLVHNNKLPLDLKETTVSQLWDATRSPIDSEDDVLGQCGEELMVMVTGCKRRTPTVIEKGHDKGTWLDTLEKRVLKYTENSEFIILLSGGGNDIADYNLPDFLNQVNDPNGPVNNKAIDDAIDQLKEKGFMKIFNRLATTFPDKKFHFVMHGYGYPPVNGRGVITAFEKSSIKSLQSLSPGPWLKPYFEKKGITDRMLQEQIIGGFIDKFNDMLKTLTPPSEKVRLYPIDLRPVNDKVNRDPGWCNEIHFDHDAYIKAANNTYQIINPILKPVSHV